ncbi:FAD-dependent oxidoreductase [Hymenobacter busanensis]|uniref:FAD-dependent oxidoreductase n=1 Tax=Hymenobacter busanensis TaxID=2607656 RepID=A0A7L4ZXS9_9BACT|nr:NAD(P)-binding domain-containing protein [Hymenobacter busanensis]KAA9333275.1 FAD-dependent oxidoreductase [Hymenobacter busanensis]QHJ08048.1 FAD-dependent oxidoreductase [Hymenobacter busanensis]
MPSPTPADYQPAAVYRTDTLIIGAGQAGLAAAYYVQRAGLKCVLLDEHPTVGAAWSERYDSLQLFSPAWASGLPGWRWPGDPLRYPTKQEAAEYLRAYAARFGFHIHHRQRAVRLQQVAHSGYLVTTHTGAQYAAPRVMVCTGGFQVPRVPPWAQHLPAAVVQLHSRDYQRPAQLPGTGPVAVVGSGNSALQIAADLAQAGRPVYLAFDERTPVMANNTLMWAALEACGLMRFSRYHAIGAYLHKQPEPVVRDAWAKARRLPNVHWMGRALTAHADGSLEGTQRTPPLEAVVWATGYGPDFNWIEAPVLDAQGYPLHHRGLTALPGLAFLGLPWLDSRSSALLGGVGRDARRVVRALVAGQSTSVEKVNGIVSVQR